MNNHQILHDQLLKQYNSSLKKLQKLKHSSHNKNFTKFLQDYNKHKLLLSNLNKISPPNKKIKTLVSKNLQIQHKIINDLVKKINQSIYYSGGNGSVKKLLVKTSDNTNIYISGRILQESQLIKNILEDIGESTDPIPLSNVSENILKIIDNDQKNNFDLETLIEITNAANYLSMENYLDHITTQIASQLREKFK